MNKKYIRNIVVMLIVMFMAVQPVFASCYDDYSASKYENNFERVEACNADPDCRWDGWACRDTGDWWGQANSFFSSGKNIDVSAVNKLVELVKFVGNMVFVIATVILGVKYIWGGVESKASVKDSLVTLVVAACMFYGFSTIQSIINPAGLLQNSVEDTALTIYSTILYVCNFLAVGGIVYIGVRYMMAGAEGRASLKTKSVPIVLGIVMVYATMTFLNFIVNTMLEIGG